MGKMQIIERKQIGRKGKLVVVLNQVKPLFAQ